MRSQGSFVKALFSIVGAFCLVTGGAARAGDLGFGFAPGLLAGRDFVVGQLIVGYADGASRGAVLNAAEMAGGQVSEAIYGPGTTVLIDFETEAKALAAVPKLLILREVKYVERNGITRLPPKPKLMSPPKPRLNSTGKPRTGKLVIGSAVKVPRRWTHLA